MSYLCKVVLDSVGPNKVRLATVRLRYPMKVHRDHQTHRESSRNASSGRSISVTRMVDWLDKGYVSPLAWIADSKGMKSGGRLPPDKAEAAQLVWDTAYQSMRLAARSLELIGVHRQDANELLMPFGWINVLVSATSYDNFLTLRCSEAARPEMQKIAVMFGRALRDSKPTPLKEGEWHLPYVTDAEKGKYDLATQLKLCVSRCGHLTDEAEETSEFTIKREIKRYEKFLEECAWSTFEHQGQATNSYGYKSGNFTGWTQYRQTLPKSVHRSFDYKTLDRFGEEGFIV